MQLMSVLLKLSTVGDWEMSQVGLNLCPGADRLLRASFLAGWSGSQDCCLGEFSNLVITCQAPTPDSLPHLCSGAPPP